ncbi:hypothetical protein UFOVP683_15 [uncultured Caudovirales phage]|uniref:Uncharacterized protein n=1 Tax=uncultured Caudovirales phage TaxID=2100421 RepID=A0A6J5NC80_9CAUD|nr:hypothetical protein UFOVP683_15 [uncultured Caudovirales phage]
MDFTSSGLIAQVKRRAAIPISQNLYTNDDIISILNEELQNRIVPWITSLREDYFLEEAEYSTGESIMEFEIPRDAIGGKIKSVSVWNNDKMSYPLLKTDENTLFDSRNGYRIENNKVKLYITKITSGKIRISYYKRPNEIVDYTKAGLITSVSSGSFTVATAPAEIITGNTIDISCGQTPFEVVSSASVTVNVNTYSVSSTTGISVGDYASLTKKSIFAQIPQEVIPLLCQACTLRMMEYSGDYNAFQAALATYQQMENDSRNLLVPKVEFPTKKILGRLKLSRWLWS